VFVENPSVSGTSPRDQAALRWDAKGRAVLQPKPGEILFDFLARGTCWRCELRTEHEFDVQFFSEDEFLHSRRFGYLTTTC
jgi:hypothetical protein